MCNSSWNGIRGVVIQNIRCFSQSRKLLSKTHYDSLGITPKATQSEIKAAYYKLSMMYHPDKNKNSEEAAQKFREITGAYEVLGNFKLKRLYDLGILHTAGPQFSSVATEQPEDPQMKFYKSRIKRHQVPTMEGRNANYDFDEWSRAHYGTQFAKEQEIKRKKNFNKLKVKNVKIDTQTEQVFFGFGILLLMVLSISFSLQEGSYDVDNVSDNKTSNIRNIK